MKTAADDLSLRATETARPIPGRMRGAASVLGLLGLALPAMAQAQCVPGTQVITTDVTGPLTGDGGAISILTGVSVSGAATGIDLTACGASSVDNAGSLTGSSRGIQLGTASAGTITNTGSLSGGISSGGSITLLDNAGMITMAGRGLISGVANTGTIGGIANAGTIITGGYGVLNSGGIGGVTNSGTILGGIAGVRGDGGSFGAITNTGLLSGGASGIRMTGGSIAAITNDGSITGTAMAIGNDGGAVGSIVNNGTLNGYNAINSTGAGASLGAITNTGVIRGNIVVQNQDATIAGGSGATFGTLTGGAIMVSDGNLRLTGNQLLDQNISVQGGAGRVTAEGVLQLSTRRSIAGDVTLSGGTLNLLASGASEGLYGGLSVTGVVTLAGGLALDLTDGYELALGDSFTAIEGYAGLSGDFDSFALNGIPCRSAATDQWLCSAGSGNVALIAAVSGAGAYDLVVQAVPEPASIGLFAAALALLASLSPARALSRRRRPRN